MATLRRVALLSVGGSACALAYDRGLFAAWRGDGGRAALRPGSSLFCELSSRHQETADTVRLRFQLPQPSQVLGLGVPGHLVVIDNAMIYRPYSPITIDSRAAGYFELLVRHYPGGELSSYLAGLKPGEKVQFRGPVEGRYTYEQGGGVKRIGMVAAGTGITPMWQVCL